MGDARELNTWKEIAGYLGKSVRTVQDWERKLGLPVRRLGETGQIVAFTAELDAWKESRLVSKQVPASGNADTISDANPSEDHAETPASTAERTEPRRFAFRAWPLVGLLLSVGLTVAFGVRQLVLDRSPQPDHFLLDGRLLTVFDARNQKLWDFTVPRPLAAKPLTILDEQTGQKFKVLSSGDGVVVGNSDSLYLFRNNGAIAWERKPGRAVMDRHGTAIPSGYYIEFVGALSKPCRNGGQIIVGAHRGPSALFVVELLTPAGEKVGEYFHFGWFFSIATGRLDSGGQEYIFLSGVDNISGNASNYGSTLVVLDPERMEGQAATLAHDERALKDVPPAAEKAVLLIRDFASDGNVDNFCRGRTITLGPGYLELFVWHGLSGLPGAHFLFNDRLQLQGVTPESNLLRILRSTGLKDVPPQHWPQAVKNLIGDIKYIRNGFEH